MLKLCECLRHRFTLDRTILNNPHLNNLCYDNQSCTEVALNSSSVAFWFKTSNTVHLSPTFVNFKFLEQLNSDILHSRTLIITGARKETTRSSWFSDFFLVILEDVERPNIRPPSCSLPRTHFLYSGKNRHGYIR